MEIDKPALVEEQSRKRKRDESSPDPKAQTSNIKKARIKGETPSISSKNVVRGPIIKLPPEILAKLKPPSNDPGSNDNGDSNESEPVQTSKGKGKGKDKQASKTTARPRKVGDKSHKTLKTHKVGKTKAPLKPKPTIRKLAPPRPWPNVPTSSSATVPNPGNNHICVTRRTPLANYLRRCHDLLVKQGFKELHLTAMGAAIPHVVLLATSLPPILPFDSQEIKTSVTTGTATVMDEVQPLYDDEEGKTQTRDKSTIMIVIRISEGHMST